MKFSLGFLFMLFLPVCVFADFPQMPMQPIHKAAEKGDLGALIAFIDAGVDVNLYCFKGRPLDLAVYSNRSEVVKYLLSKNALAGSISSSHVPDLKGLIIVSALNGYAETFQALVAKENISDDDDFIGAAALGGNLDIWKAAWSANRKKESNIEIKFFGYGHVSLKKKIKPNVFGIFHPKTLLDAAIHGGNREIVDFLLDKKAKPSIRSLCHAAIAGDLNTAKKVCPGLDINEKVEIPTMTASYYVNVLHMAAANGQTDIARFLLEQGVDSKVKDSNGKDAMYYAVCSGVNEMVCFLASKGLAMINDPSLFHGAVSLNNKEKVTFLLERGFDINCKFSETRYMDGLSGMTRLSPAGRTVLHNASCDMLEFLLKKGANPNIADVFGRLPVYLRTLRAFNSTKEVTLLRCVTDVSGVDKKMKMILGSQSEMNALNLNEAGYKLYQAKSFQEAEEFFRWAIVFDPTYEFAIYNLACVLAIQYRKRNDIDLCEITRLLAKSFDLVPNKKSHALTDSDLDPVREEAIVKILFGETSYRNWLANSY